MATKDADPSDATEKVATEEKAEEPKAEGESEGEEEDAEYKVEAILEVKKVRGKPQYLIKWEGYEDDENSWEPEDNLDCQDLLDAFKATPGYLDKFGGGSGGAEASKGDAVKAPAKKKQKTSVDDDYVEAFKEDPEDDEPESDQDDDEWGEEDDGSDSDDNDDSDAEGETYDDLRPRRSKAQRDLQRARTRPKRRLRLGSRPSCRAPNQDHRSSGMQKWMPSQKLTLPRWLRTPKLRRIRCPTRS